jgi:hypothetical protein
LGRFWGGSTEILILFSIPISLQNISVWGFTIGNSKRKMRCQESNSSYYTYDICECLLCSLGLEGWMKVWCTQNYVEFSNPKHPFLFALLRMPFPFESTYCMFVWIWLLGWISI